MNEFEFFKDYCGFDKIVCLPTMVDDIMLYYHIDVSYSQLINIYNDYLKYYNFLWSNLKEFNTNAPDVHSIKKVVGNDGTYHNVVKVDFEKAILNYVMLTSEKSIKIELMFYFNEISKYWFPNSLRKYLYIYTITNVLTKKYGKSSIIDIQNKIYQEIQYNFLDYGYVIKSEMDGVYLQPNITDYRFQHACIGKYSIHVYKWLIKYKTYLVGLDNSNKLLLKGLSKDSPNIFHILCKQVTSLSLKDLDKYFDDLSNGKCGNVLDYLYKSDDGQSVRLFVPGMCLTFTDMNQAKYKELLDIKRIDVAYYINAMSPLLNKIYAMGRH